MSQGRHGIKVLGLSLIAALGLMAFTAVAAQAGEYRVKGGTFTAKGVASESVSGTVGAGKLLVPGLGITFECTGGAATGTVLLGGVAHATVLFSGCSVAGNKFCKTFETKVKMETETEPGFLTASGLGSIILHGGEHYLLVATTEENKIFSTIYLTKSTKGCTLPLEETVSGGTLALILNPLIEEVTHTAHPLTQAQIEALFPTDLLNYGNQRAWLDGGTFTASLSGANKGQNWSVE